MSSLILIKTMKGKSFTIFVRKTLILKRVVDHVRLKYFIIRLIRRILKRFSHYFWFSDTLYLIFLFDCSYFLHYRIVAILLPRIFVVILFFFILEWLNHRLVHFF